MPNSPPTPPPAGAHADATRRESETRLQLALEASRIGTHTYDAATDRHALDARAQEISGLPSGASLAEWTACVNPDDLPQVVAAARRALDPAGDGVFDEEYRLKQPHDGERWVYVRSRTVFERAPDGRMRPARVIGTIQDVTARKETEQALQRSEAQLRRIAEAVPDILFRTTPDGHVDFVNAYFEALTGYAGDAVEGSEMWPTLIHADDRDRAWDAWRAARAAETDLEVRYRLLTVHGPRWVITRARPFREPDGTLTAWFGTVTDVDALTRAEDAVRDLNATLETRVALKTALARRLSMRLAEAEQAERRRIAHVLHDDLQQRLAGLSISVELIARKAQTAEARELAARATEILGGALHLTRTLASDLSPAVLGDDDVGALMAWLAERAHDQFGLAAEVAVDGPCPVPGAAVRALLVQAVPELLFNVVKHAGVGAARVRARRDGADVVVAVEDDGAGFIPSGGGAGFGLPSIRERVEGAGGTLAVRSAPGRGTRVTVTVPAEAPA